jgi:hypothetical protein
MKNTSQHTRIQGSFEYIMSKYDQTGSVYAMENCVLSGLLWYAIAYLRISNRITSSSTYQNSADDLPDRLLGGTVPDSSRYRAVPCYPMIRMTWGKVGRKLPGSSSPSPTIVESAKKKKTPSPGIRHGSAPGIATCKTIQRHLQATRTIVSKENSVVHFAITQYAIAFLRFTENMAAPVQLSICPPSSRL